MPKKLPEGEGKRVPLNMRTTQALREKLDAAAADSGRSLAQEIELRLERSFDFQSIIERTISLSIDRSAKEAEELISQYKSLSGMLERHLVDLNGGDDLFLFWGVLASAIRRVEDRTGKSVRDDGETCEEAEREVLGAIPGLFRRMPESYSSFKARISSDPRPRGALEALAQAKIAGGTEGS